MLLRDEPESGKVRDKQQEVRSERDDGRVRIEGQEESDERGGEEAFPFRPVGAPKRISNQARQQCIDRPRDAEDDAGFDSPEQVDRRDKRRLVEPDITIEDCAMEHAKGGGEREVLFAPKHPGMEQVRGEKEGEQSGEKQNSTQNVLVWNKLGRIKDEDHGHH